MGGPEPGMSMIALRGQDLDDWIPLLMREGGYRREEAKVKRTRGYSFRLVRDLKDELRLWGEYREYLYPVALYSLEGGSFRIMLWISFVRDEWPPRGSLRKSVSDYAKKIIPGGKFGVSAMLGNSFFSRDDKDEQEWEYLQEIRCYDGFAPCRKTDGAMYDLLISDGGLTGDYFRLWRRVLRGIIQNMLDDEPGSENDEFVELVRRMKRCIAFLRRRMLEIVGSSSQDMNERLWIALCIQKIKRDKFRIVGALSSIMPVVDLQNSMRGP